MFILVFRSGVHSKPKVFWWYNGRCVSQIFRKDYSNILDPILASKSGYVSKINIGPSVHQKQSAIDTFSAQTLLPTGQGVSSGNQSRYPSKSAKPEKSSTQKCHFRGGMAVVRFSASHPASPQRLKLSDHEGVDCKPSEGEDRISHRSPSEVGPIRNRWQGANKNNKNKNSCKWIYYHL